MSDSDDDADQMEQEYPSLDSVPSDHSSNGGNAFSPNGSEPPSLTESMMMVNDILSDKAMDRSVKIDKLEAILSAVSTLPDDTVCTLWTIVKCYIISFYHLDIFRHLANKQFVRSYRLKRS